MAKKDKTLAMELTKVAVTEIESAGLECPPCLEECLAVDFQTVIRDAALDAYEDAESVLGELQLIKDDCLNNPPE